MEHSRNDTDRGQQKALDRNLFPCYCVNQKSHIACLYGPQADKLTIDCSSHGMAIWGLNLTQEEEKEEEEKEEEEEEDEEEEKGA